MASFWMRGRTRAAGVLLLCLGLFVFLISGCGDAIKKAEMSKNPYVSYADLYLSLIHI